VNSNVRVRKDITENQGTKLEKAPAVSDEIPKDIENSNLAFEQILLECRKPARLNSP
jgi:hypothetical protein